MQVTTELLNIWFDELNRELFNSELPVPRLATGNSRTMLGSMRCKTKRTRLFKRRSEHTIRISNYYEMSEDDFRNVLLHEMIHYYISVKGIKDTSPHGLAFRRIMADVNACGWHVNVRERRRMPVAEHNLQRKKPYLVLLMTFRNGTKMTTVANAAYAKDIEHTLCWQHTVEQWEWRTSTSSVFNSWPKVRTLRARRVSEAEFDHLMGLTSPLEQSI